MREENYPHVGGTETLFIQGGIGTATTFLGTNHFDFSGGQGSSTFWGTNHLDVVWDFNCTRVFADKPVWTCVEWKHNWSHVFLVTTDLDVVGDKEFVPMFFGEKST